MAYLNATRLRRTGIVDRIAGSLATAKEAWRRHALYRQTLRELNALSARDLADLGLNRSMLNSIATEAAYGK